MMLEKIFYPWTKEQPDRQEVEIEDQIKEKTFHKNAAGWEPKNSEFRSKVFMPRVKKRSKLEKKIDLNKNEWDICCYSELIKIFQ